MNHVVSTLLVTVYPGPNVNTGSSPSGGWGVPPISSVSQRGKKTDMQELFRNDSDAGRERERELGRKREKGEANQPWKKMCRVRVEVRKDARKGFWGFFFL